MGRGARVFPGSRGPGPGAVMRARVTIGGNPDRRGHPGLADVDAVHPVPVQRLIGHLFHASHLSWTGLLACKAVPPGKPLAQAAPATPAAPAADQIIARFSGTGLGNTGTFIVPADGNWHLSWEYTNGSLFAGQPENFTVTEFDADGSIDNVLVNALAVGDGTPTATPVYSDSDAGQAVYLQVNTEDANWSLVPVTGTTPTESSTRRCSSSVCSSHWTTGRSTRGASSAARVIRSHRSASGAIDASGDTGTGDREVASHAATSWPSAPSSLSSRSASSREPRLRPLLTFDR